MLGEAVPVGRQHLVRRPSSGRRTTVPSVRISRWLGGRQFGHPLGLGAEGDVDQVRAMDGGGRLALGGPRRWRASRRCRELPVNGPFGGAHAQDDELVVGADHELRLARLRGCGIRADPHHAMADRCPRRRGPRPNGPRRDSPAWRTGRSALGGGCRWRRRWRAMAATATRAVRNMVNSPLMTHRSRERPVPVQAQRYRRYKFLGGLRLGARLLAEAQRDPVAGLLQSIAGRGPGSSTQSRSSAAGS